MKSAAFILIPFLLVSWPMASEAKTPTIVTVAGFNDSSAANATHPNPVNHSLGFIVEKDGFLITNYRNLTDPATGRILEEFRVKLINGTTSPDSMNATVVGVEPTLNIGILKIESGTSFEPSISARDRPVTVGDKMQAVSSIGNGEPHLTEGRVVGLNTRQCYQESLTSTMFRAKIDLGEESHGGPVFFADSGEVAAIYTGYKPAPEPGHAEVQGETHLLPISLCFNIYESIKQKRSLKSPWTGFSVRALNESEQKFFPTGKKHHGGVAIEHVWENSPAQKLGIQVNDILVQFSYNRILSVADFQKWLYMYGVGHPVKLMILRNGTEYLVADYVIDERPQWAKPK